ncbi:MAG: T9SS type A sorting domain-containing protein, partial [Ekhidna sp.]|nr:T9SS type A sorting domain-containing protein [Ekhidna sp.]
AAASVQPVVTIAAGTSPVTEGTEAAFTLTAAPAPMTNLTVSLSVTEAAGSDFVASADKGMKTVTIPAASGNVTMTYTVATVNDDTDEENGSVTVTVADGSGYTVGTPSEASVTVNDDDDEEAPLGADDAADAAAVIFPNPSGRYLEVRSPIRGTFQLLSLSGKPLLEGTTNTRVDITSLQSGLYLVQLPDGRLLKFVRD